jgi:hypothetical protein
MNGRCLDIGIIQAFLDGELSNGDSLTASRHLSECPTCSSLLAEAEAESAVVFPALEREFNTLVPTHRLWSKINDSIADEERSRPLWKKLWAGAAVYLGGPSLAAAAGLIIIMGIAAIYWTGRIADTVTPERASSATPALAPIAVRPLDGPAVVAQPPTGDQIATVRNPSPRAVQIGYVANRNDIGRRLPASSANAGRASNAASGAYLPGEESYVKTIANLSTSVAAQKDTVMRPSERVAFERDLAVVDDSIKKMRGEVRKNPRNESAKQVLYSSYQNKIDLLNSVSQKEELMASLSTR